MGPNNDKSRIFSLALTGFGGPKYMLLRTQIPAKYRSLGKVYYDGDFANRLLGLILGNHIIAVALGSHHIVVASYDAIYSFFAISGPSAPG